MDEVEFDEEALNKALNALLNYANEVGAAYEEMLKTIYAQGSEWCDEDYRALAETVVSFKRDIIAMSTGAYQLTDELKQKLERIRQRPRYNGGD